MYVRCGMKHKNIEIASKIFKQTICKLEALCVCTIYLQLLVLGLWDLVSERDHCSLVACVGDFSYLRVSDSDIFSKNATLFSISLHWLVHHFH